MRDFNDKCPNCGDITIDYEELRDHYCTSESAYLYWNCRCTNCGCHFKVKETYGLICVELQWVEGEEE